MASRTSTKILRVLKDADASFAQEWSLLCDRSLAAPEDICERVESIISQVQGGGDSSLRGYVEEFDGATLKSLEVTREEWDEACEAVDSNDRAAIGKSARRIREFHRKRIPSSWEMREEGGAYMGQRVRPLARVGIYTSGNKALRPSSVIMSAVPASVVEVREIVLATPPNADGTIRPELLMAARVAGVHRVFKMGGAHAIAAMTFGTETVPQVDRIVGSGNNWVSTAKRQVRGKVGVDTEVGPSEICIVADSSATPAWVAADLLSQAEQDEFAQTILITHIKGIATRVQEQVARQVKTLEHADTAMASLSRRGAIVLTKDLNRSIELANELAAQQLVLAMEEPETVHKAIVNAGTVFMGHYTPIAVGNYLAGPNHVLPTGGSARFYSPLGVDDFLKRTSFMRFEPPKLRELGAEVIRLSEVEGLSGHGRSVDLRLQKIRRVRREREAAREAEI